MPNDPEHTEFSEFILEEIALGRAPAARARLAAGDVEDAGEVRARLRNVRDEVEQLRDLLLAASPPESDALPETDLARFLDGSLSDERRTEVERLLAHSPDARRQLVALYRETAACAAEETLPPDQMDKNVDTVTPFDNEKYSRDTSPGGWFRGVAAAAVALWLGALFGPGMIRPPAAFAAVALIAAAEIYAMRSNSSVHKKSARAQWLVIVFAIGIAVGVFISVMYPAQSLAGYALSAACVLLIAGRVKTPDQLGWLRAARGEDVRDADVEDDEKARKTG